MLDKTKLIEYISTGIKLPNADNPVPYIVGWNDACDRILREIEKGCMDVKDVKQEMKHAKTM